MLYRELKLGEGAWGERGVERDVLIPLTGY